MQQKDTDDFKICRVCRKDLDDDELKTVKITHMPALCQKHMEHAKKQFKKCQPLLSKMKF